MSCRKCRNRLFRNVKCLLKKNGITFEEMLAFTERNKDKITCMNISRHLQHYVEESPDEVLGKIACPTRIDTLCNLRALQRNVLDQAYIASDTFYDGWYIHLTCLRGYLSGHKHCAMTASDIDGNARVPILTEVRV